MAFREVAVENDGEHLPEFASTPVLRFESTDIDLIRFPENFILRIYIVYFPVVIPRA
jgi:hypothetical protein